ncbi:MAG: cyclic nucleotide-binding protein [Flammeovirgaceae bacterium]|nr:cyclic nucleotide-binding protein [Flammeovirgaceae bacterium]MBE60953.1 cyclic nucleotide-binding protein [Flammeovirgaceae bacterium]HCX23811.1 Crp/Fnr family transcriptional regulator [Cytophagales bacterium]|tara:strand:+ start:519 stop:1109 length:591 start_codon:yes stop_codon:yes gene_type:complete
MKQLFEYLGQFGAFSQRDKELIGQHCKPLHLKKGCNFLEADKRCTRIGLVTKGVLRAFFFNDEGKDITKYFIGPEQFATDLRSLNEGILSETYIQAESDSELIVISQSSLKVLAEEVDNWETTVKNIIESRLLAKVAQKTAMLNQDATTRYTNFVKENPDIFQQVPLGHIATYLGITQHSLSRIRKSVSDPLFANW